MCGCINRSGDGLMEGMDHCMDGRMGEFIKRMSGWMDALDESILTHMGYPLELFVAPFIPCHDAWSPKGPQFVRGCSVF